MSFCTKCGANVTGAFCQQCGQPLAGAAAGSVAPPPASPPPAAYAPPADVPAGAAPAKKKMSPVVIVLLILGGLFLLGCIGVIGAGIFVVHKVKQAGIDPELMQKNPGLAMSKLIVAANPDLEVLNYNEGKGVITVREKSTGKVVTLNFDDVKRGRIRIESEEEGGKRASVEFGADSAKLPSWVPPYPGAKMEGTFSGKSEGEEGGMANFTTRDAPAKVISFYEDAMKTAGFKITATSTMGDTSMITAEDQASKRNLVVTATTGSDGNTVNILFGVKK